MHRPPPHALELINDYVSFVCFLEIEESSPENTIEGGM